MELYHKGGQLIRPSLEKLLQEMGNTKPAYTKAEYREDIEKVYHKSSGLCPNWIQCQILCKLKVSWSFQLSAIFEARSLNQTSVAQLDSWDRG